MVTVAVLLTIGVGGQSGDLFVLPLGLPGIDLGVLVEEPPRPERAGTMRHTGGAPYVPGRVIVKFKDGASTATRLSTLSAVSRSSSISQRPSYANFDIVQIDPSEDAAAVAAAAAARPDVEYAQPAYRVHTMLVPNDPFYSRQWNLRLVNLEKAWDIQPQAGSAIIVAVLDTGMALANATLSLTGRSFVDDFGVRYPALGPVTIPVAAAPQLITSGRIVSPHDFIWNTDTPFDLDGHGTHVSGTIGQLTNDGIGTAGVAFNVKLMPVKVIDTEWDDIFRSPFFATDDTVARGIRYAADNGAKVINMSIGRNGFAAPAVEDAMRYAVGKGVFVVISGGNGFEDIPPNPREVYAEIASRIQGVVSVAAVDPSRSHAFYSTTAGYIELAAPGGVTRGFGPEGCVFQQTYDPSFSDTFTLPPSAYHAPRFDVFSYVCYIGTSMAAPHVSGVAAMMMQQGITDPAAIEAALEKFAVDLGAAGRDDTFGFGLVDARAVLRGLGLAK